MTPQRVTIENFLCFGERTVVEFTDDEPLWVLGGPNGVGKSAVFDAMTFCLYNQHRGGGSGFTNLVRHGANGFHVSFDFAVGPQSYRVTRGRSGNRTVQSAEIHVGPGDHWRNVPNVTTAAHVTAWVVDTVGLSFDAFTASVLLRQNDADKVVCGNGTERLAILKRVVGLSRYEQLWERVHDAAQDLKRKLWAARNELGERPTVTAEQLAASQSAAESAEATRTHAAEMAAAAGRAVDQAGHWAALQVKRAGVTAHLAAAEARAADADRLRVTAARHTELAQLLPRLRPLPARRDAVARLTEAVAVADASHDHEATRAESLARELTAARVEVTRHVEALATLSAFGKDLAQHVRSREGFQKVAQDADRLTVELNVFPADIDAELARHQVEADVAYAADRAAGERRSHARTLFTQAEEAAEKFARVAIGVSCSECGQEVTAGHADRERDRLAARLGELRAARDATHAAAAATSERLAAVSAALTRCSRQVAARDTVRAKLTHCRETLVALECTESAAELTAALSADRAGLEAARGECVTLIAVRDAAEGRATTLAAEADAVTRAAAAAAKTRDEEAKRLIRATADLDALLTHLDAAWHGTTAEVVAELDAEFVATDAAGLAATLKQLDADAALRPEWQRQLAACEAEAAAIPEPARVPVAEAEQAKRVAAQALAAADSSWQAARDEFVTRTRHHDQSAELTARLKVLEADHARHVKLDELLGKTGLQRHLVRGAERAIVHLADETLGKLSGGDLSVALDDREAKEDEAFALCVRRAGGADPIGVAYLSGSQKFRVAVAVALAIGRHATNQSRQLECVIIDEGFGSLDRDGLRATADELNALKQHLKRIILVSHQEEFTEQFPVVIQLSPGENGTVARQVRR